MQWVNQPPRSEIPLMPIIRPPADQRIELVMVSDYWVGLMLHWWNGSKVVHVEGGRCAACEANNRPQWEGFIGCTNVDYSRRYVLGLCPSALDGMRPHYRPETGLYGALFSFERWPRRPNGMIRATLRSWLKPQLRIKVADLQKIVCRIHKIRDID